MIKIYKIQYMIIKIYKMQYMVKIYKILYMMKIYKMQYMIKPSVGSCHHGMARPLGCGWGSRPPDMEVSCEYIE